MVFNGNALDFEVFGVSAWDTLWKSFDWTLGSSWGSLGTLLPATWGPYGPSWGRLKNSLGGLSQILEGSGGNKPPKMPPRAEKLVPERLVTL